MKENKFKFNRGNLRDLIIILAVGSAFLFPVHYSLIIASLVLMAIGTTLHVVTEATLVRNRVLCTEGVYRICRHPYYLSNFVVDMSLCLLSGNIYLVMIYPFLFFWAYGPTLKFEEGKLADIHGEMVHEYLLKTPQIFPTFGSFVGIRDIIKETSFSRISPNEWVRISRFWAVGMAMVVAHEIGFHREQLLSFKTLYWDTIIFSGLAILLLISNIVLRLMAKSRTSEE